MSGQLHGAHLGQAIIQNITMTSRLPAALRGQLEVLVYFNGGQHRVRHAIEATIERWGQPEIVEEDGDWLRLAVTGAPEVQALFALHESAHGVRVVGAVMYVRDSVERITVVHVSVAYQYTALGMYARERVLSRLLNQIREVARRTTGIRQVELAYRQSRLSGRHAVGLARAANA